MALGEVLDRMGAASARAQGLSQVITTMEKLRTSENHIVYIITRKHDDRTLEGADVCVGFLKVGRKRLFILDSSGGQNEVLPVSVLDFYVHESLQRHGYGRQLFDVMLKTEQVEPVHLAIDRPSDKLTSFLAKHYGLRQPCPQMNNFVVYPGFFSDRDGDVVFRVRPALAVRCRPAGGRRSYCGSSLEPAPASPSPALRWFGRRGRRRLVTSCPPPADPRLTRAASQTVPPPPLPPLSGLSVSSPARPASVRPASVRPASVRPGSGCSRPVSPPPAAADSPLSETRPRYDPAAARFSLGSDSHPGRDAPPVSVQPPPAGEGAVLGPTGLNLCPGVGVMGAGPVPSPQKTGPVYPSEMTLPELTTGKTSTAFSSGSMHPVNFPHKTNASGLLPMLSPRTTCTLPRSDMALPTSPLPETGSLPHPEGWCAGGKLPLSPRRPTSRCRLSRVPLPACEPTAAPPIEPSAAPPAAGPASAASYPYPWLVSKDELFYPNKRNSPLKNGYEVTSMVGVNGSPPVYSRHSHDDSASAPCRAGSRQVRNLHDHHQLW